MAEETPMFDRIINSIAERSETIRQLRANDEAFKTMLAAALGDAAPADQTDAAGFVAGVEALQMQWEIAYDAERLALKLADDLLAEQQLIAEKLGLLETDDEPADANPGGQTDSEIAAEREGQAMINEVSDAAV